MSRIQELTNDFDKSLNLNSAQPQAPGQKSTLSPEQASVPFPLPPRSQDEDVILPPVPPQMESVRSHSANEIVQMMNKTPLFMTSLEDAADGRLNRIFQSEE